MRKIKMKYRKKTRTKVNVIKNRQKNDLNYQKMKKDTEAKI